MKRLVTFALLLATVFGTGCASTYTTGRKSGLGLEMPASGQSKVVFVRPGQFMGGQAFGVHDGDKLIGVLPELSYFVYDCEPGQHLFSSTAEDVAVLEANLLPGRIYYAKVSCQFGVWSDRVNMYSLHPGCAGTLWPEMPKILSQVKETIVKPATVTNDQKGAARYMERVTQYLTEYRLKANREQILPEHGQTQPIAGP